MVNVNKMDKFYEDANDQHVRATFVYIDDAYVYADKELTTKIDAETMMALFLKGEAVLVRTDESIGSIVYMIPLACTITDGYASIFFNGGFIYSAEYVSEGE